MSDALSFHEDKESSASTSAGGDNTSGHCGFEGYVSSSSDESDGIFAESGGVDHESII